MQITHILFVELSDSTINILHNIILHFSNINLLTDVSKFYTKPLSTFYGQVTTRTHMNANLN